MKFPTQLLWGLFHKPKINCPRKWTLRISRVNFRKIPPFNFASLKLSKGALFFSDFFFVQKNYIANFGQNMFYFCGCNSHLRIFQGPLISFRLQHASPPQKIPKPEQVNPSRLKVGFTNPQRPPVAASKGEGTKLVMTSLGHHHLHKGATKSVGGLVLLLVTYMKKQMVGVWSSGLRYGWTWNEIDGFFCWTQKKNC